MQYKELPPITTLQKIKSINFKDGQKNLQVFKWCLKIQPLIEFVESERVKIIKKYLDEKGEKVAEDKISNFLQEFSNILNMEIEEEVKSPIEIEWFDNCDYPEEDMLLTASEIEKIISK